MIIVLLDNMTKFLYSSTILDVNQVVIDSMNLTMGIES